MINVTKPFLPPIAEYQAYLEGIWSRGHLTNSGPLVLELEKRLKEYLGLDHLLFLANGTVAIQLAIKALDLRGEIITTPFSFIATSSCIVWEGSKPVFVDIDADTFNIDPAKIEAAITPRTCAILATHVFGNPCDIDAIEIIAKKHNLKVIYDAAHCFGTNYKGKSVFAYGDISTTSFHATKLYHTVEGGAVFTNSPELLSRMNDMKNFGHNGPENFSGIGINGKNSEYHAAMGLTNFKYIREILKSRRDQYEAYQSRFAHSGVKMLSITPGTEFNYAYFPVVFESEEVLFKVRQALHDNNIYPRRYFYPSINTVGVYHSTDQAPISESVSSRILCLPVFHDLTIEQIDRISGIVKGALNNQGKQH